MTVCSLHTNTLQRVSEWYALLVLTKKRLVVDTSSHLLLVLLLSDLSEVCPGMPALVPSQYSLSCRLLALGNIFYCCQIET